MLSLNSSALNPTTLFSFLGNTNHHHPVHWIIGEGFTTIHQLKPARGAFRVQFCCRCLEQCWGSWSLKTAAQVQAPALLVATNCGAPLPADYTVGSKLLKSTINNFTAWCDFTIFSSKFKANLKHTNYKTYRWSVIFPILNSKCSFLRKVQMHL